MAVPAESRPPSVAREFKDFRTFLNAFSANISKTGMFLEVAEPESPGSEIEFRFALEGGDPLLRGRGEVAWVADDGDADESGMAVRFVELDADSEHLIERIEEIRTKSGREIFDIDRGTRPAPPPASADAATTDLLRAEIESLKQTHLEERARLTADLDTVRQDRDRLAKQLHELEQNDTSGEREAMRVELEAARAEAKALQARVEEQDGDLARFAEQGRHAMAERDRLEARKRALAEELESARAEIDRFESERQALGDNAAELDEVRTALAAAEATQTALHDELTEARAATAELEGEASGREEALRSQLEEVESEMAEMRQRLAQGQSELDDVRGQFEDSASRNLELEHEAGSLRSQLDEMRERLEEFESAKAEVEAEMERLQSERAEMASRLISERKVAKRAKKVASRVRAEHARLQEDLAEAQAALEEVEEPVTVDNIVAGPSEEPADEQASIEAVEGERGGEFETGEPEEAPQTEPEPEPEPEPELESEIVAGLGEVTESPKAGLWATLANKIMGEGPDDDDASESAAGDAVLEGAIAESEAETEAAADEARGDRAG